ncbi:hypothetical protein F4604DRAFT_1575440 [Suillus subluteus]|nr:hypothetical protein F4604DRAFT_1575440 [Suillus subluteus]
MFSQLHNWAEISPCPTWWHSKKRAVDKEQVKEALSSSAHYSSFYLLDVFLHAVHLMHIPLSVLLFLWMLACAMIRLSSTLHTAFALICYLPFISWSAVCHQLVFSHSRQLVDFPQLMQAQSSTFGQLIDGVVGQSGLSLEIRKAGFVTGDLIALVRNSDLKSNDVLADLLVRFVKDAKNTARSLTKLSSKVGGAVDNVMAVNRYAMHTIQDVETISPYLLRALVLFRPAETAQGVIIGAFSIAMDTFSMIIERLILEAKICLRNLDTLEEDLLAIHEVAMHEDAFIAAEKSELLAVLWTKLGGNKHMLQDYEQCLCLLKDISDYQRQAQAHIVASLQTLNSMSEDMEDLRERVAAPQLVDEQIPIQVHIESIQSGLQQLQEGQVRAKEREEDVMRKVLTL